MTHLILHKVRGEPAFDIAEQLENGWWIIPTSGHRAYPYWTRPLDDYQHRMLQKLLPPEGHPDHYSINDKEEVAIQLKPKPTRTLTIDDLD